MKAQVAVRAVGKGREGASHAFHLEVGIKGSSSSSYSFFSPRSVKLSQQCLCHTGTVGQLECRV